jgi:hypothetical protein
MLGPGWDAFYGGLMRTDEDAAARGMKSRVDLSGIGNTASTEIGGSMPSPLRSLRGRAAPPPPDDSFDPTDYQMGRAELDRTLHDNLNRQVTQHAQETALARHADPSLRAQDADREQADEDTRTAASFRRMEPTRALAHREQRMTAEDMLQFNPAVIQSRYKLEGTTDTNDTKERVAETQGNSRVGASALTALSRAAGTQTFGDPNTEKRVGDAIGAIQPNVPNHAAALKQLPPEWDYNLVVEKFNGNAKAADEWLALHGYRR